MITVYGGGSWGTALGHVLASAGHEATLLLRDKEVARAVNERHENPRYLAGLPLAPSLRAVTDTAVLKDSDVWVLAVPCQSQRGVLESVRELARPETVIVNAAKGIELTSLKPLSVVSAEALHETEGDMRRRYAMLSGPSFAREVIENKPSAVVLGCADEELGARLRAMFATPFFRCYSSPDVRGVELGGAVKNVIAIAAGVCDGLQFGDNARAALVTRGWRKSRGLRGHGARASTFMGLSGWATSCSPGAGELSRNRQVGLRLGRGERLEDIVADMHMVAEGVKTTRAVNALARKINVDMPISSAMDSLLDGRLAPRQAAELLMSRALKEEGI